jgi:hypothetical protein
VNLVRITCSSDPQINLSPQSSFALKRIVDEPLIRFLYMRLETWTTNKRDKQASRKGVRSTYYLIVYTMKQKSHIVYVRNKIYGCEDKKEFF